MECTLQQSGCLYACIHECYHLNILHCRPETIESGMLMDGEKYAAVVRYINAFTFSFVVIKHAYLVL